ncbi:vesicle-fusing ATPase 2-like [Prorops nasuta]|uniref:vesicle-fusing ATPase 2-like n=1 Tax=Prorops nasuta TaxID=863751 RepID=UPI0034CDCA25
MVEGVTSPSQSKVTFTIVALLLTLASQRPSVQTTARRLIEIVIKSEKAENSSLDLVRKSKAKMDRRSIINPEWDFQNIGIGGLDKELNIIFRRAIASRFLPFEVLTQLGMKHTRGILLYGPPGTGKTLIARKICSILNTVRKPIIVDSHEMLYENIEKTLAHIRRLFADAEEEEKRMGPKSGLYIIILENIDALCKPRGSVVGNTEIHDAVINQLLCKLDGVEQLNNILVIGTTNRRDMIDEALLRPGILEVQMEINLPDENGRLQILQIHTATMRENDNLSSDVDLRELAEKTKNFTGAELEDLVRAAQSTTIFRLMKISNTVAELDSAATETSMVSRNDFLDALSNDINPAFGCSSKKLDQLLTDGIIIWGPPIKNILSSVNPIVEMIRSSSDSRCAVVLLEGTPKTGKTALAAHIAKTSNFPFIKVCTPEDMVGFTESAKCEAIKKIFNDAYYFELSCILFDDIENLLDYNPIGPSNSNLILQAFKFLLRKQPPCGRKLLILCTTSNRKVLDEMDMLSAFTIEIYVPEIFQADYIIRVCEEVNLLRNSELPLLQAKLNEWQRTYSIGIKTLLHLTHLVKSVEHNERLQMFLSKL